MLDKTPRPGVPRHLRQNKATTKLHPPPLQVFPISVPALPCSQYLFNPDI